MDLYKTLNELLDHGVIECVMKVRTLTFRVRAFYEMPNGWLECVVQEDIDLPDEESIHIAVRKGLPITIFPTNVNITA